MSGPGFEAYLASKRIDSAAFKTAEPEMWEAWAKEFEQMHPNSFTVQKLNLINPVRRKYQLAQAPATPTAGEGLQPSIPQPKPVARPGKPVIRRPPAE